MSLLLRAAGAFCLGLATFFLFGWATIDHPLGWGFLGLTLWCVSGLVGPVIARVTN